MKRSALCLLTICVGALVSGCQTHRGGSACDGWQAIKVRRASVDYLVGNDPNAAMAIVAHNEHGAEIGCWNRPGAR